METKRSLPFPYNALNALGTFLRSAGLPIAEFDEESLCKAAMKGTKLSDFGDPYFREGLQQLLYSAENDANFHFLGQVGFYRWILLHLMNRLLLVEMMKRQPEIFRRTLIPPVIILGLPRSGTTFLHRLLALDPAHRAVPMWELAQPIPPLKKGEQDRRRQQTIRDLNTRIKINGDIDRKHYIRADEPEECMWMLGLTFVNLSFWTLAPVYSYLEWYLKQDLFQKKYQDYLHLLHVLQSAQPARRLILKAPEHTGQLGVLLHHVPEAMIIQTHRDPVTITTSLSSLFASTHSMVTHRVDLKRMADANVKMLESGIKTNLEMRKNHPNVVYDISYSHLVADPIVAVKDIYTHFQLPWREGFEAQLQNYLEANPPNKHGKHHYQPEDFGQTFEEIARHFLEYREAYDFSS